LTIHSSKGLEFPAVFLVNLVSQRFPTTERKEAIPIPPELIKEILPEGDYHLEEERRLFYVGMTRAKDQLYLTAADYYGEGKREKRISPFVIEALGEEAISRRSSTVNSQLSILDYRPSATTTVPEIRGPIDYLSYSQIEAFRICPLQYKYQYLLRIPTPPSAAATFGEVIHESMKDFYQRAMAGQKPTTEDLVKILEENWTSVGFISKVQEARMKKEGQKILEEYFKKAYHPERLPKALEQKFSVKVSANLKIGGKIDRIDETERRVEIIDYKTGSSSTKREAENDLQLTVYALVAAEGVLEYTGILAKTPKPEAIKVSFYFFDKQKKISSVKTKDQLEQAKKELVEIAQKISQSDFSPTPSKMCDFCDYKLLCEAWK
jgi:DNA helicase-2/ATP-dependent DNA helicase PcrA